MKRVCSQFSKRDCERLSFRLFVFCWLSLCIWEEFIAGNRVGGLSTRAKWRTAKAPGPIHPHFDEKNTFFFHFLLTLRRLCALHLDHLLQHSLSLSEITLPAARLLSKTAPRSAFRAHFWAFTGVFFGTSNYVSVFSACKPEHSLTQTRGVKKMKIKNLWRLTNVLLATKPLHDVFMYFVPCLAFM